MYVYCSVEILKIHLEQLQAMPLCILVVFTELYNYKDPTFHMYYF